MKAIIVILIFTLMCGCDGGVDREVREEAIENLAIGTSREDFLQGPAGSLLSSLVERRKIIHLLSSPNIDRLRHMCDEALCVPDNLGELMEAAIAERGLVNFDGKVDEYIRPTVGAICMELRVYYGEEERIIGWSFHEAETVLCR